jgi:hypothetical protein
MMETVSPDSDEGWTWENSTWLPALVWTRKPSLEAIERTSRRHLGIPSSDECAVAFFAEGAYNRLYSVHWSSPSSVTAADSSTTTATTTTRYFLMRITMPVVPRYKTAGEVATLRWIRAHTSVPVPGVLAYDDSRHSEIGFEWILMELVAGAPVAGRWRSLTMGQKTTLVERVAGFQAEMLGRGADVPRSECLFGVVGTLTESRTTSLAKERDGHGFMRDNGSASTPTTAVEAAISPGPLVTMSYVKPSMRACQSPPGPFDSTHDWLMSLLEAVVDRNSAVIARAHANLSSGHDDEDADVEDEELWLSNARRIVKLLPSVFPPEGPAGLTTALMHDDLSRNNILIDESGAITAIVDWECAPLLPLWAIAIATPLFIQSRSRDEIPERSTYGNLPPPGAPAETWEKQTDEFSQDNEGKCELYWEHLDDWECSQLRRVYGARLGELWPEMAQSKDASKTDMLNAVENCDNPFFAKRVAGWLSKVEQGETVSWDTFMAQ